MESEITADRWKKENRLAATIWLVLVASSGWLNWRPLKNHSQTCCRRFSVLQVKVIKVSKVPYYRQLDMKWTNDIQMSGTHKMAKYHWDALAYRDGRVYPWLSGRAMKKPRYKRSTASPTSISESSEGLSTAASLLISIFYDQEKNLSFVPSRRPDPCTTRVELLKFFGCIRLKTFYRKDTVKNPISYPCISQ